MGSINCGSDIDGHDLLCGDTVDIIGGSHGGKRAKVTGTIGRDLLVWPVGGHPTWVEREYVRFSSRPEAEPAILTQAG